MENNETYFRLILEDIFDESQESKSIDAAKKYLINLGYSAEKADKYVRETVRELFPTLRSKKGGKFILGMTRISLEMSEMLNNSNIIELNNVLKLVVDGHYDEYDRNLNNLSPQQLIKRFALSQKENDTLIKTELKNMSLSDNGYSIIQINSFEDAQKYSQYTDWCITNNETMYNTYTSNGANQFYFCLKDGFENFEKEKGENCPLDEYGLSMIAVAVDPDGSMYTCTSRWNHDCGGDDSVMGVKQLSQIIGQSFYDVFKPNNVFNEIIAKVSDRLKNGEEPNNIFDIVGDFNEGFATVVLGDKCNWISENNEILSPNQWFDTTDPFLNGVAAVGLKHKWNFMRKNGYLLSPSSWFDDIETVFNRYGVATVIINGKPWLLKTNMLKIPKTCEIDNFSNVNNFGLCMAARSDRNGKREFNFVNINGEPICKEWFLSADGFTDDGIAMIESERGFNFINTSGQYVSPNLWFEDAFPFDRGLGEVSHQDRWWNIDKNGKLIENNSLNESIKTDLSKARKSVDKNPSEKQKESGNYKKGHITINGFKITIENPKGSYRCGTDSNGKKWKIKMNNDYGYFLKTEGYDGDHVDVFLGDDFNSKKIFVVDQFINGKFDESKVMLGFNDIDVAKQNYLKNYENDWKGFKEISEVPEELFKKWLYDGKKQRKPFYDYNIVKNVKKMKIKESVLRGLIQESIKKVTIKEGRKSTKLTNRLIDMLYKVAQKYKSKYHDDDWSNVHAMLDEMRQLKGISDLFVGDGRYRKHGEEFGEMTKVYKVNILTDFNTVINGTVNCHLCGTIDNPWSAYDISVSFYRANENAEILESISKTLNEDIRSAVTTLFSKSDLVPNPTKQIQNVNINGKNVMAIVFDRKWIDDDFQKRINNFLLKNPSLEIATIDDNHAVIINKDAKEGEPLRINKSVDDENFGEKPFYTMDDWRVDGSLKPEIGDYVEDEVIEELANSVPPTTYSRGIFQPGEAYDMSEDYTELYMTFVREQIGWKYVGLCPKGSTKQLPRIDYSQFNESVNESNILSELDWRTYASASEKAAQAADNAPDKYERMRRDRQRHAFYLKGNDEYSKQYGLEDFDANEKLPNSEKTRIPSQGELKRASHRIKDMTNFYQGKQEYKDGSWQDKE